MSVGVFLSLNEEVVEYFSIIMSTSRDSLNTLKTLVVVNLICS